MATLNPFERSGRNSLFCFWKTTPYNFVATPPPHAFVSVQLGKKPRRGKVWYLDSSPFALPLWSCGIKWLMENGDRVGSVHLFWGVGGGVFVFSII